MISRWVCYFYGGLGGLRGTMEEHFGRFGVPLDLLLGVLGWPLARILGVAESPWACWAHVRHQDPPDSFSAASFLRILAPKRCPGGSQNGAKIVKKTILTSIEILVGFLSGFWNIFVQCWQCFWDPGPSKMSVWCRRGAIFQKFTFFIPDSVLD